MIVERERSDSGLTIFIWCVCCRLDVYIYDYLIKRNLQASAKAFLNEGKVSSDPVGMYSLSILKCLPETL